MGYNLGAASKILLDCIVDLHPPLVIKYHIFVAQLAHLSPCQLTILTSWMIVINPYDSSNHYHPWK
jgi:hypothetical protein